MSISTLIRRRGAVIAAGTAVVLATGVGATAAFADGSPTPSATSSTGACAPHLRALLRHMPAELKADLKDLRAQPKGERADERKAIRKKALAGEYGSRIEHLAHIVAGKRAAGESWFSTLPESMQTDLKALRKTEPGSDERKAEARAIADKALAGTYGETIQTRAKAVQERCAAR